MENNDDMLPPPPHYETEEQRADAMELHRNAVIVPLRAETVQNLDRIDWDMDEEASGTQNVPEVPGSTAQVVGDEASAGTPNDAELQLVLRNAHPLQDESLSLNERVNAFRSLEREAQEARDRWKAVDPKPRCEECGKKHAPPHKSQEQVDLVREAFKKGHQLRKELEQASNPAGPSQSNATMADAGAAPSAPPTNKGKSVLCTRCAKWHAGGANACTTPFCTQGCGLAHPPLEDCEHAAKRFSRVRESRKAKRAAPPTPSSSSAAAASSSSFDPAKFGALLKATPNTEANMNFLGSVVDDMLKRSAAGPAENAGSSQQQQQKKKKKNKKTGQGSSCQGPQSHHKGPPKPDDKGKGKETANPLQAQPESSWT